MAGTGSMHRTAAVCTPHLQNWELGLPELETKYGGRLGDLGVDDKPTPFTPAALPGNTQAAATHWPHLTPETEANMNAASSPGLF